MDRQLSIYISAAPAMDPECELLGQTLAQLTPAVRWEVRRTPRSAAHDNLDLDALRASPLYLILLGADIVAPMGVEWMAAQQAHLHAFAYRSTKAVPSPAASAFARNAGLSWIPYDSPLDLQRQFERALIEALVDGTPGLGLHLADIESLAERLRVLEGERAARQGKTAPESEERRGAGGGGIILPRGRT
jgi:hypothetical protein